jgi:glutathione S-transferase
MKLYVCWGTNRALGGEQHPCRIAHRALLEAGHDPEVLKVWGFAKGPAVLQRTAGRRQVEKLSGQHLVPVLVADDGEVVVESRRIVEWAEAHPRSAATIPV